MGWVFPLIFFNESLPNKTYMSSTMLTKERKTVILCAVLQRNLHLEEASSSVLSQEHFKYFKKHFFLPCKKLYLTNQKVWPAKNLNKHLRARLSIIWSTDHHDQCHVNTVPCFWILLITSCFILNILSPSLHTFCLRYSPVPWFLVKRIYRLLLKVKERSSNN